MRPSVQIGVLLFSALLNIAAQAGDIITTIAGGPTQSFQTGNVAISKIFPRAILLDPQGNLLIADDINHAVLKFDVSSNLISLVAGNGYSGFSGDGQSADQATLNSPSGIAFDNSGNLYISDSGNHCIRKINKTDNTISTVVGTGMPGYSGDGGAAHTAQLYRPLGISFDSRNNLYIADSGNNVIRKVDVSANNTITTYVYTAAALNAPSGIAFDSADNLYIADNGNQRVHQMTSAGTLTTLVGTGTAGFNGDNIAATSADLNSPVGLWIDNGQLLIADQLNQRLRRVNSGIITTVAGSGVRGFSGDGGVAQLAQLNNPTAVTSSLDGTLYIADYNNYRIRRVVVDNQPPSGTLSAPDPTNSTAIELSLSCSDNISGCTKMRLANSTGTFSGWLDYSDTIAWNISSGDGIKTIYAELQDLVGNISSRLTATTRLDTTPPELLLYESSPTNLSVGDTFVPNITASDSYDGDLTAAIVTSSTPEFSPNTAGDYLFRFEVSDAAGNIAVAELQVVVGNGNSNNTPPVIDVDPIPDALSGSLFSVAYSLADADGDPLTVSIDPAPPAWLTLDETTYTLTGTPTTADIGTTYSFSLIVSDGITETSIGPFEITVQAGSSTTGNTAPVNELAQAAGSLNPIWLLLLLLSGVIRTRK